MWGFWKKGEAVAPVVPKEDRGLSSPEILEHIRDRCTRVVVVFENQDGAAVGVIEEV